MPKNIAKPDEATSSGFILKTNKDTVVRIPRHPLGWRLFVSPIIMLVGEAFRLPFLRPNKYSREESPSSTNLQHPYENPPRHSFI